MMIMSSTIQKGNRAEVLAMEILESKGWNVIRSPRTMKCIGPGRFISQANDYFGLYDLIAKKANFTIWIQVKSTAPHVSTIKPKIAEFHQNYMGVTESSEVWQKVPRKGFIKHVYSTYDKQWMKEKINLKGESLELIPEE